MDEIKILMCGSDLSVKGGIVSVIKNYLGYSKWDDFSIEYVPTHIEKNKYKAMFFFLKAYLKIIWKVLTKHYDILYLHTSERGSFYRKSILARTLRMFGLKVILHHHGAEFEEFYANSPYVCKKYINNTLECVDLNIVLSERLIKMITDKAPNARVRVLYNAVTTYPENPYNLQSTGVLFLGRLGKRKGTYDLVQAIKNLDSQLDEKIQFYLCGGGEVEEIKNWITQEKLGHRIAHIGWIDGKEKTEILRNTMINVLPSYNEGLPMTILETMAYGIPNISTKIASIPEVIFDGQNGFLIEPGDVEVLQEKLLLLCSDADLREKFSKESWVDISERFALDNHISQLKKYIGEPR